MYFSAWRLLLTFQSRFCGSFFVVFPCTDLAQDWQKDTWPGFISGKFFKNFNDSLEDAKELWQFTKYVPSKVNIIEYNPISEANFTNTKEDTLSQFANFLEERGVNVNVRRSRGKDIDAACGQLANKN